MRPCFLPKTRTDPCVAQWQVRLIDNIIIVKRQESVFSGRNQVQIFPLDLVNHILKVCERNCPGNDVASEEVRRLVELEAFFRNKVQSILDERMVQTDKILSKVVKASSGDTPCPLDIDETTFES